MGNGGSVGGGHGSFIGGAGDGVPDFNIPVRTLGLFCQGQSMKTPRTNIVLLKLWSGIFQRHTVLNSNHNSPINGGKLLNFPKPQFLI